MQVPIEITFHGMEASPAVEAAITRWLLRLEQVYDRIQRCHVWVDLPHRHQRRRGHFQVRIDLTVPDGEVAVANAPGRADVYVALSDAFRAARRQLQDHARIRRGDIKTHAA